MVSSGDIKIEQLTRGSSNIYRIMVGNNQFVLKEFNSNKTLENVEKEVKVINYLRQKNLLVPTYIKTSNDKDYILYEGKIIILQNYIKRLCY